MCAWLTQGVKYNIRCSVHMCSIWSSNMCATGRLHIRNTLQLRKKRAMQLEQPAVQQAPTLLKATRSFHLSSADHFAVWQGQPIPAHMGLAAQGQSQYGHISTGIDSTVSKGRGCITARLQCFDHACRLAQCPIVLQHCVAAVRRPAA